MAKSWSKPFYNSTAWKVTRMNVLIKNKYRCAVCGRYNATEVHHIKPLTQENINDIDTTLNEANLMPLCHECHTAITLREKNKARRKELIQVEYSIDAEGRIVKTNSL